MSTAAIQPGTSECGGTKFHLSAHPDTQVQLSPLLEELIRLPSVIVALIRNAESFEGEQQILLETRKVPVLCIDIVRQLEGAFLEAGGRLRRGDNGWRNTADRAAALGSCLGTGRRTMSLAADAMGLPTHLRRAEEAGESPPYTTSAVLQEINAIKEVLNHQFPQEQTASWRSLVTFLDFLKTYVDNQSTTVPMPDMTRLSVTASTAAFSGNGKYLVVGRCMNGHHARTDSGILNMWEIQT
ncbi:hypothetical protein LY78DRAFT_692067 [Colletotrichum sublineola]|nr:hypothetical protein LY78DRAFT_692067 [Colletotrichum sublineola]